MPASNVPHSLPLTRVRQQLYARTLPNLDAHVARLITGSRLSARVRPGGRIAITGGSRGIANIARITAATARTLRGLGYEPFIVPAMGSHGGGVASGQVEVLASLGITEASCECPILATMDVVELGKTRSGVVAYLDRHAADADGIVVINRVKKHTDFRAPLESGVAKMIAIGLGKRKQADLLHSYGATGLIRFVPEIAEVLLASGRFALGLAITENGYDETADIAALEPETLLDAERSLLRTVKRHSPSLPFADIDVLVVERIGKNISGTGMDTNIIGRFRVPGVAEPKSPSVQSLVALGLTPESHGNAIGIGLADIVSQRLIDQMDRTATYVNGITSGFLERVKLPVTMPSDETAVGTALSRLTPEAAAGPRVVRIADTLHIAELDVSDALLAGARERGLEIVGPAPALNFDRQAVYVA